MLGIERPLQLLRTDRQLSTNGIAHALGKEHVASSASAEKPTGTDDTGKAEPTRPVVSSTSSQDSAFFRGTATRSLLTRGRSPVREIRSSGYVRGVR